MKIIKYIPDSITSMNLVCGLVGVIFAFRGRLDIAFILMLGGALFDFFDGFAARALNAYSEMGKELDSLCDMVTFGVLPAAMMYSLMKACMFGETWLCFLPFVLAVFSALRLAKFNVDPRQSSSFIGLPTPAAAILAGSLCHYIAVTPESFLAVWAAGPVFIPALALILSFLLVSEIPMFSLKMHKNDPQALKSKRMAMAFVLLASVLVCIFCHLSWSMTAVLTMTMYIIKNIAYAALKI